MKILMATDVVSPFCWMAPKQLELAMAKFPDVEFELELWPFQVTPGLPQDYTFEQYQKEHMSLNFGNGVKAMLDQVTRMGAMFGLEFRLNDISIWPNTKKAHGLWMMHPDPKQRWELHKALCKAHFNECKNLNDVAVLAEIGADFGLNKEDVHKNLDDDHYIDEVLAAIEKVRQQGINSVPFIVLAEKYAIAGAKGPDELVNAIQHALDEQNA
jgi:predicted DsbA family dithiol-disulfide isomerase